MTRTGGEKRRSTLVEEAIRQFGREGYHGASLDQIATAVGVRKQTLLYYFPNKEAVFREMVRHIVVSQLELREREYDAAKGTATEALTDYMRGYWVFIRSTQFAPLFRLINAEIHNFPDLAQFYADEVVTRKNRLMAAILTRGMESGEFRRLDPLVAARMLSAPFVMHGLWCTHREHFASVAKKSDDQIFDELIQFYFHAIKPLEREERSSGTVKS